jgi:beta-phosphoglucomutase-like phosphatase (HAD superfamily)
MSSKPESEPIWKDYEFLDRANSKPDSKDEKAFKQEIERMKHENKDFAAELDKAQSLLRLQTDIERENRQYY